MKLAVHTNFAMSFFALLSLAQGADVVSIWGGARGTVILKSDGTVWTWGANFNGKLRIGETNMVRLSEPVEVHGPGNISYLNSIKTVMGGEFHNVALKNDGTVWCWGWNGIGQLGDGTTNDAAQDTRQTGLGSIPPLTSVTKLGGRPYFTIAVKSDGTVWAWGMRQVWADGQRNHRPDGPRLPGIVSSNSWPGGAINSPQQVTCGYQFGAALTTNGTVWTWGSGSHGEAGRRRDHHQLCPGAGARPHKHHRNLRRIWFHILALRADGTVWDWGK